LYATLVVFLEWWVAHSKHREVSFRHALAIGFVAILPALVTTCSFVNKH
jgi:dienelactone hydrolase